MTESFDPYHEWLGIPPSQQPADHYGLLGVPRLTASMDEIRSAAEQRMVYVRSFQTGPRSKYTQRLLNELANAKLCLSNPQTRAAYDSVLRERFSAPALPPVPHMPPAAPPMDNAMFPSPVRAPGEADESVVVQPATRTGCWLPIFAVATLMILVGLGIGLLGGGPDDSEEVRVPAPPKQPNSLEPNHSDPSPLMIQQDGDGQLNFPAESALVDGPTIRITQEDGHSLLADWESKEDTAVWEFEVARLPRQGAFRVALRYAADEDSDGIRFTLTIGERSLKRSVKSTGGLDQFAEEEIGYLAISRNGHHTLAMTAVEKPRDELMVLESIRLIPVGKRQE